MDEQISSTPVSDFLQALNTQTKAVPADEVKPAPSAPAAQEAEQRAALPATLMTILPDTSQTEPPANLPTPETTAAKVETLGTDALAGNKIRVIVKALRGLEQNIANIIKLLEEDRPADAAATVDALDAALLREAEMAGVRPVDGRVIEGVFDGQQMVGSDGKIYTVPPNYASKSKLVEGDMLKLTITPKGSFIYKQIGPIERSRIVASLGYDPTNGEYYATCENKRWSVIKASVTYFKGETDDEVVLLVPKNAPSKWAAVENIIKKNPLV